MSESETYTIAEAAALTGKSRNTIRMKVRLGQLDATVQNGKFGEEYRISRRALVKAGLLEDAGPLDDGPDAPLGPETRLEAEAEQPASNGAAGAVAVEALAELYQRHEQAMFRLGYMQGELDRMKALAETAESLREDRKHQELEMQALKRALEEQARQTEEAEALRVELEQARRRLQELEALRADLDTLKSRHEAVVQSLETTKRPWWRFGG